MLVFLNLCKTKNRILWIINSKIKNKWALNGILIPKTRKMTTLTILMKMEVGTQKQIEISKDTEEQPEKSLENILVGVEKLTVQKEV